MKVKKESFDIFMFMNILSIIGVGIVISELLFELPAFFMSLLVVIGVTLVVGGIYIVYTNR